MVLCGLLLAGCAEKAPGSATVPSPTAAPSTDHVAPVVGTATPGEPLPCADPELEARVDAALAAPSEGLESSLSAAPEEMPGADDADIASQERLWAAMPAEEVERQQCLRLRQGLPEVAGMPSARGAR
jgi:hypothetical protein